MAKFLIESLTNVYAVTLVVFGIGFVIFIHELGHFLAAKWAGVKVEKFAIGFGPVLVSFRKGIGFRLGSTMKEYAAALEEKGPDAPGIGETEYSLRALPLGGYVKMLGEDPGGDAAKSADPRAYPNRPVTSRMVIISAGVVMNMIFGYFCFVGMYMLGVDESSAVVGSVVAGQPAYEAGFRPGDNIVAIDGHRDVSFQDLMQAVVLSGTGQKVKFEVQRAGSKDIIPIEIEPKRSGKSLAPTIGVRPSPSLQMAQDSPPTDMSPGGLGSTETTTATVTAVGPKGEALKPVTDILGLDRELIRYRDRPMTIAVDRGPLRGKEGETKKEEATIPPVPFRELGIRMTPGMVAAVRAGSPAASAGIRKGDEIVSVDGKADYDPMTLPDLASSKAGQPIELEIRRPGEGSSKETIKISVTPDDTPIWTGMIFDAAPLDIPGLGLAVSISTKVAAVAPGSPAEKAGIKAGEVLKSVRIPVAKPSTEKSGGKTEYTWDKAPLALDDKEVGWPMVFSVIQTPDFPIRLAVGDRKEEVELTAIPSADRFDPMRGLQFQGLTFRVPPQPIGEAMRRGWRDAREATLSFYVTLRSLFQQRVGAGAIVGPLNIGKMAFGVAKYSDFSNFLRFLAMIGINLAVVNFLPIPPLDGGQMTFLIAEKIRGRPLPDDAIFWPTIIGLGLVLTLFVVVSFKDILSFF